MHVACNLALVTMVYIYIYVGTYTLSHCRHLSSCDNYYLFLFICLSLSLFSCFRSIDFSFIDSSNNLEKPIFRSNFREIGLKKKNNSEIILYFQKNRRILCILHNKIMLTKHRIEINR